MGNVSYRFLLCFFDFFLMEIIFVNYLIWSGAFVDIVGGTSYDLSNTYFGFQSVLSMISSYGQVINSQSMFTVAKFKMYLNELVNNALLGLPTLAVELGKFNAGGGDILKVVGSFLKFFGLLTVQPAIVLFYLLMCVGCVLFYAFTLIAVLFVAMSGAFNVPIEIPLPPMPIEEVVDSVRITVPVLC